MERALSTWDPSANFGQGNPFQIAFPLPIGILFATLAHFAGIEVADKFLLTLLFVAPAFTARWFASVLFPEKGWLHGIVGWCYALSPLLLQRYYVPILPVQLIYALTPAILAAWLLLLRGTQVARSASILVVVEALAISGGSNIAFWFVPHFFCFLMALGLVWVNRTAPVETLRRLALASFLTLAIHAYWLVPQLTFGLVTGPAIASQSVNHAYTIAVRSDLASQSFLDGALRMASSSQWDRDQYGTYWTYGSLLRLPFVAASYYVWVPLALLAVFIGRKDRRIVMLGCLLILSLYAMKGESPPLQWFLQQLYRVSLFGTVFRYGFDKFIPGLGLALAFLMPLGCCELLAKTKNPSRFASISVGCLLLFCDFPYWTGQMFMARSAGPTLATHPPVETRRFLRELDAIRWRMLIGPASLNPLLVSTRWGYYGPNVYPYMTSAPMIAMPNATLSTAEANGMSEALYDAVSARDTQAFLSYARLSCVSYILVADDLDNSYYGGGDGADWNRFIASIQGSWIVKHQGPYTLWHLPVADERPGALQRYSIANYDTDLLAASILRDRCAQQPSALLAGHAGACSITEASAQPSQSYRVLPSETKTQWVRSAKRIEGVVYGIPSTGARIVDVRYDHSAAAASIDNMPLAVGTNDVVLRPGAQHFVRVFAQRKTQVPIRLSGLNMLSGAMPTLGTSGGARNTFRSTQDFQGYVTLGVSRPGPIGIDLDVSTTNGSMAITVKSNRSQRALMQKFVETSQHTILPFTATVPGNYYLYYEFHVSRPLAEFSVKSFHVSELASTFTVRFLISRVEPGSSEGPYVVDLFAGKQMRVPTIAGSHVVALPVDTSLVQNYQFDPLWVAWIWEDNQILPHRLEHTIADGFKNAWILPRLTSGVVTVHYINDWIARGLCIVGPLSVALALVTLVRQSRTVTLVPTDVQVQASEQGSWRS